MFGVGLCSQSGLCVCRVMPGLGWAVEASVWHEVSGVAQIRDAVMLLGGCGGGLAEAEDKPAQTKAKLRPEGRSRAPSHLREWSLCAGELLSALGLYFYSTLKFTYTHFFCVCVAKF